MVRFISSDQESFFWATQAEAELDLLIFKDGKRFGFECKYTDVPKVTKSVHSALHDLNLEILYIIHPGKKTFPLSEKIIVCGVEDFIRHRRLV